MIKRIRRDKEKSLTAGELNRQRTKRPPHKCFRYDYVDNIISKCSKPSKDNKKRQKNININERANSELHK